MTARLEGKRQNLVSDTHIYGEELCKSELPIQICQEISGVSKVTLAQQKDIIKIHRPKYYERSIIFQTVPAKEPQFDAVPLKSALKKPMSAQEKHINRQPQTTPTQENDSESREYARFGSQNDSSTR